MNASKGFYRRFIGHSKVPSGTPPVLVTSTDEFGVFDWRVADISAEGINDCGDKFNGAAAPHPRIYSLSTCCSHLPAVLGRLSSGKICLLTPTIFGIPKIHNIGCIFPHSNLNFFCFVLSFPLIFLSKLYEENNRLNTIMTKFNEQKYERLFCDFSFSLQHIKYQIPTMQTQCINHFKK